MFHNFIAKQLRNLKGSRNRGKQKQQQENINCGSLGFLL